MYLSYTSSNKQQQYIILVYNNLYTFGTCLKTIREREVWKADGKKLRRYDGTKRLLLIMHENIVITYVKLCAGIQNNYLCL